jgi:hypothetical protein
MLSSPVWALRSRLLAALALVACTAPPVDDTTGTTTTSTTTSTITTTSSAPTTSSSTTGAPTTGDLPGWTVALQLGNDRGALLSVWGPAPDDVYAVGGQLVSVTESAGILYHYDGAAWTAQDLPAATPMLHWIFGTGGDLWTVGRDGAALRREGDVWVPHPTGVTEILWGIWGAAPDDMWTVGGDGVDDDPVLVHWDGAAWTPSPLPDTGPSTGLFKIWGTGPTDITAVGDRGLALHYDGAWTVHPTDDLADLISVWGRAADDQLAVGGRANGRLARWDGAAWDGLTLNIPGLSGVWMDPDGLATVVGMQGQIGRVAADSLEFAPEASPTFLLLHAVFGFAGGPRFAVGGNLAGQPPYVGVIVQTDE